MKKVALYMISFLFTNLGYSQIKEFDIKTWNIKSIESVVLNFHNNDSISLSYGTKYFFDTLQYVTEKWSWTFPPLRTDTLKSKYYYNNYKLDKIIPEVCKSCYDNYLYDSLDNLISINRHNQDGSIYYTFYINSKKDEKDRVIEKGTQVGREFYKYNVNNLITEKKVILNENQYEITRFEYTMLNLIDKEMYEFHQGVNKMTIVSQFSYNNNNDVIKCVRYDDFRKEETTEKYGYIYDESLNWIIKFEIVNGELSKVTKRKIEYYIK